MQKFCHKPAMDIESKLSSPEGLRNQDDFSSVPYKKIKKICCIGAGYVVGLLQSNISLQSANSKTVGRTNLLHNRR